VKTLVSGKSAKNTKKTKKGVPTFENEKKKVKSFFFNLFLRENKNLHLI